MFSKFLGKLYGCLLAQTKLSNVVTVEHIRDGKVISRQRMKNIVVNGGLDWMKNGLSGSGLGTDCAKYIGLSTANTDPAAGATDLDATVYVAADAVGLERQEGTYAAGGTGVATVAKTFTCTGNSKVVGSAGLYYKSGATAGMFAGVKFAASTTLMTNDQLVVTWTLTYTSA